GGPFQQRAMRENGLGRRIPRRGIVRQGTRRVGGPLFRAGQRNPTGPFFLVCVALGGDQEPRSSTALPRFLRRLEKPDIRTLSVVCPPGLGARDQQQITAQRSFRRGRPGAAETDLPHVGKTGAGGSKSLIMPFPLPVGEGRERRGGVAAQLQNR